MSCSKKIEQTLRREHGEVAEEDEERKAEAFEDYWQTRVNDLAYQFLLLTRLVILARLVG